MELQLIDQTMLEAAFIVFMIGLLALMFLYIVVRLIGNFSEQVRQAKWRARQRQKKVIDVLSPSLASRRRLHPQVSGPLRNGQQAAEDELMGAWADIVNIVDDKETDE